MVLPAAEPQTPVWLQVLGLVPVALEGIGYRVHGSASCRGASSSLAAGAGPGAGGIKG